MGQLEDLQAKGFGSHGGKTYEVHNDIKPLKKRVLVSDMHFGVLEKDLNYFKRDISVADKLCTIMVLRLISSLTFGL